MGISTIHLIFAAKLPNPEAIDHPEYFLSSKYQSVLDFWWFIDGLSCYEKNKMKERFLALDEDARWSAVDTAWNSAGEVVGWKVRKAAGDAASFENTFEVFGFATLELIGGLENKVFYDLIMSHKNS